MRLLSIHLENFQGHKDTTIKFAPGLTGLVGPSDSGKTSILRALTWIWTNRPGGIGFVRVGESLARVTLETDKGTVVREKGKRRNAYQLISPNGHVEDFDVVGKDVPNEIAALFDISELNYQSQLTPHFLVLDSPGAVAEVINRACRLDQGYEIVSWLARESRRLKTRADELAARNLELQEELEAPRLRSLDRIEQWNASASELLKRATDKNAKAVELEARKYEYDAAREIQRKTGKNMRESRDALKRAETASSGVQEKTRLIHQLEGLSASYDDLCADLRASHSMRLAGMRFPVVAGLSSGLAERRVALQSLVALRAGYDQAWGGVAELERGHGRLEALVVQAAPKAERIQTRRRQLDRLEVLLVEERSVRAAQETAVLELRTIQREMDDFKKDNPNCPLCGAPWEG